MEIILSKEVSFDLAKLLNEKGYDKRSEPYRYNKNGEMTILEGINAPTIAEVVDFIFEKYKIWIVVYPLEILVKDIKFTISIYDNDGYIGMGTYNTPLEAYEEAIDYVLQNY